MSNNLKTEDCNAIVEAISYWLGYQSKIGREQLIHEASLRYPVVDTITANGIGIKRIVLEKNLPLFSNKVTDLVIYNKDIEASEVEEDDDTNLEAVFEFKLAKRKTGHEYGDEHQRVFDDVARLAYYNGWRKKECFFLMCGKYSDFKNYFIGQMNNVETDKDGNEIVKQKISKGQLEEITGWKSEGIYSELFDFVINGVKIQEFTTDNKWGLKKFQKNYKFKEETGLSFSKNIKIKTICIAITAYGLEKTRTHAAGIWKIECEE